MSDNSDTAYSAAELGSFARDETEKENELLRSFAGTVGDSDRVSFMNYLDSLISEDKRVEGGLMDTQLGQEMIANSATLAADRAADEGNVSQMQSLVGLTNNSGDGADLLSRAAQKLSDEGAIGLTFGPPGAGKTATVLDTAATWKARTGGIVVSNIDAPQVVDHHVTTDAEALHVMQSTPKPCLLALDEVREQLKSDNRKRAEQFADALRLIRKKEDGDDYAKRGAALLVAHTQKGTAPGIRRLATFGLRKPQRDNPGHVELLGSVGAVDEWFEEGSFSGLTDTSFEYDEHEASDFRVVLQSDESDESDEDPEEAKKDIHRETAIRACKPWSDDKGMNYRDAAELVPFGKSWVGDRVREWRNGDHRHLVSDPRDE
jgi:hypothetical protein